MKRKLDNKTLDAIGKKLIKDGRVGPARIDRIVSNPNLFGLISERIASDGRNAAHVYSIRRGAVAFSAAGILVVMMFAAVAVFRQENAVFTVVQQPVSDVVPEVARPVIPPQGTVLKPETGRVSINDMRARKAVAPSSKTSPRTPRTRGDGERYFYPVAYTGDPAETAGGGRIIRVDMNRSSLFALGVSLPLENDNETVRADLLVGADGVTRGVRVVK